MKLLKDIFWFTRTKISGREFLGYSVLIWLPYLIALFTSGSYALDAGVYNYNLEGLSGLALLSYFVGIWGNLSLTYRRAAQFSSHPLALIFGGLGLLFGNAPGTSESKLKNKPDNTKK